MNPGFHIGGIIDFQFTDLLSLETGLILDTKGFKFEEGGTGYSYKEKLNTFYLDIPIVLKVSVDAGSSVRIFGTAGPYIGIGLTGKWKSIYEYQGTEDTDEEKVEWGNTDDDHLKRLDYGLTFGAGVEIKAFLVGISYDLGLANISAYTDLETKVKNRVLRITVGFWFGKN
jgi:opacity protein-like surface antigen